jgi:hypothetical protein
MAHVFECRGTVTSAIIGCAYPTCYLMQNITTRLVAPQWWMHRMLHHCRVFLCRHYNYICILHMKKKKKMKMTQRDSSATATRYILCIHH